MDSNAPGMRSCTACGRADAETPSSFMQRFRAQFGKPVGFWGQVAGWIMGHRPSNRERNAWAASLLNVQPSDHVLEIGCGPGLAIARMSTLVSHGQIVGIDHSEVMLDQARKRNTHSIARGRVELLLASVSDLPPFRLPFDKILSVNSVQYWGNPTAVLRTLRRLMNPGGRIAIALQPRFQGATNKDTLEAGRDMVEQLKEAGFRQVRLEIKPMKPVSVACAVGINEA